MDMEFRTYRRHASLYKYTGADAHVTIPDTYEGLPVTEIEKNAFLMNSTLETLVIPKSLTLIGAKAFACCERLQLITCQLPGESTDAPEEPVSLLPEGLHSVECRAFFGTQLKHVEFLSENVELAEGVFRNCANLYSVYLTNCIHLTLEKGVFHCSALVNFFAPKARIDVVPQLCFAECSRLTTVMCYIEGAERRAFYGCKELANLHMPKELNIVGTEAFEGCSLLMGAKKDADDLPFGSTIRRIRRKQPRKGKTPLLKLEMVANEQVDGIEYSPIRGFFTKTDETYYFQIQSHVSLFSMVIYVQQQNLFHPIAPLLDYFVEKKSEVELDGDQVDENYWVYELTPGKSADMTEDMCRDILQRLTKQIPPGTRMDYKKRTPPLYQTAQCETILKLCKDQLPGWVKKACEKNMAILQANSGLRDDESKHARRAMQMLLNIDWLPGPLQVPPAREVKRILDEEFYGLDSVKRRVMEIVAQIRRTGKLPKYGLLLTGSAGTGKTSIAKAIARILDMNLILIDFSSLGENTDKICGTYRMYSNARPGTLLQQMYENRSCRAILLINEVDKAIVNEHGNGTDALLSILDRQGIAENFLDEIVPCTELLTIATCNTTERLTKPLLDRFDLMPVLEYTSLEKKTILSQHILPQMTADAQVSRMSLSDEAVELLMNEYALEPGARDLEKYMDRFIGDYSLLADESDDRDMEKVYQPQDVRQLLGPGQSLTWHIAPRPGQVNGAFYYEGRAYFYLLQAAVFPGTGKFEILGPMPQSQRDYAKAAYLSIRNSGLFDLSKQDISLFVNVPIPESSANHVGMACYAAICSALSKVCLDAEHITFLGGCDLNGFVYCHETNLTPLLRAMECRGFTTVYSPIGTNELLDPRSQLRCNVTIIEGPDAATLFTLAATQR